MLQHVHMDPGSTSEHGKADNEDDDDDEDEDDGDASLLKGRSFAAVTQGLPPQMMKRKGYGARSRSACCRTLACIECVDRVPHVLASSFVCSWPAAPPNGLATHARAHLAHDTHDAQLPHGSRST